MQLNSLQFLRGVAAILVVYEHSMDAQMKFGATWQQNFYHLDNFGCIGVDLFFVISGFIITYVANNFYGTYEGIQFLQKRFFRINPIYYIASGISIGLFYLTLLMYNIPFSDFNEKSFQSLIDTIAIIPSSKNVSFYSPLLIVGWTLCFEWLFYLLFFLLIISNVKKKTETLIVLIISLVIIGQILQPNDLRLQFITNPIMLEFLLGVIICKLYLSKTKVSSLVAILFLATGLISYLFLIRFGFGNIWHYQETLNGNLSFSKFFLWGLPSAFIVTGLIFLEKNSRLSKLFNNRLVLLLGNASYSIYLIHYTVIQYLVFGLVKYKISWQGDIMIWLQLVIAVSISIAFYKLIEKPILRYLKRNNKSAEVDIMENDNSLEKKKALATI